MSNNTEQTYIEASRKKYRFQTPKGLLTTEDLWDLSLTSLDVIAVSIDNALQTAGGKSFIRKREKSTTDLENQLSIVKHVIETKQAETEASQLRAQKQQQKEFLNSLLEKKKIQQLESLSPEEIEKQLKALDN